MTVHTLFSWRDRCYFFTVSRYSYSPAVLWCRLAMPAAKCAVLESNQSRPTYKAGALTSELTALNCVLFPPLASLPCLFRAFCLPALVPLVQVSCMVYHFLFPFFCIPALGGLAIFRHLYRWYRFPQLSQPISQSGSNT